MKITINEQREKTERKTKKKKKSYSMAKKEFGEGSFIHHVRKKV